MYLNNSLLLIVFKSFILRKLLQVWLAQRPGRLRSPGMVHDPCSQLHIANPHHLTLSLNPDASRPVSPRDAISLYPQVSSGSQAYPEVLVSLISQCCRKVHQHR